MKKRVCILTATRAEYGLLRNVISKFNQDKGIDLRIAVTGMHLCEEYGMTYKEIEKDGFTIDVKIPILLNTDDSESVSSAMGLALIHFGHYFARLNPDVLIVLGDRYETLAVCIAAMNQNIPIAHIHGGEITEGAIDDAIRHSITKMSYLHFTSTEEYQKRVIQLGEEPDRVFWVGALGVENALELQALSKTELEKELGISLVTPFLLSTFHPVTLEDIEDTEKQIDALLSVAVEHSEYIWIFTKANADAGGKMINRKLDDISKKYEHIYVYASLGMKRYLSAMKYAEAVIGNTSSGILETPSFHIPTINIGDRQKGRIQARTIVNCRAEKDSIEYAIGIIKSDEFRRNIRDMSNPYFRRNTSEEIYRAIKLFLENEDINLEKRFYDIEGIR